MPKIPCTLKHAPVTKGRLTENYNKSCRTYFMMLLMSLVFLVLIVSFETQVSSFILPLLCYIHIIHVCSNGSHTYL